VNLREIAVRFKKEFEVYRLVSRHPQTPRRAKLWLGLALGYVLMPFDLIPDFIPVVGQLDDLVLVPFFVWMASRSIPASVFEECRAEINQSERNAAP